MSNYKYLGGRLTSSEYKGQECIAVRNGAGKCIRGRNGSMLVAFNSKPVVVIARLLKKIKR